MATPPSSDPLAALRRQVLDCEPQEDGSVAVTLAGRYRRIDLTDVELIGPLVVAFRGHAHQASIELTGLRTDHHVRYRGPVPLRVVDGELGTLEVALDQPRSSVTLSGEVGRLVASAGTSHLEDATIREVLPAGGQVEGDASGVGVWVLEGDVPWVPNEMERVRVRGRVEVAVGRNATLQTLEFEDRADRLVVRTESRHGTGANKLTVVDLCGPGAVELANGGQLQLSAVEGGVTVLGKGRVHVPASRTVVGLHVEGDVSLSAGPGAALERFTGALNPVTLEHVTATAPRDGSFTFGALRRTDANRSPSPAQLRGTTLRGVRLSDDSGGRRAIHDLAEAAVVEPRLHHLRVVSRAWRRPFGRRKLIGDVGERAVDDATYFAQELAGLLDRKCSSGALRTRSTWAAYRGRQLNAGPSERFALGMFRLVGYGQRAGPPALTWLVAALVATLAILAIGPERLQLPVSVVELFLNLLLAPLFLLRLAGDLDATMIGLADLTLMLFRTIVAVPFVFTLVAIGRYLRSDWPWRN